jgi:uncharacterized protein YaaQ
MKLILAVVNSQDADNLIAALTGRGLRVTTAASAGGFLLRGNTTMFVVVENDRIDEVMQIIEGVCNPPPEPIFYRSGLGTRHIGRATAFVLDIEQFEYVPGLPLQA